jgi:putative flippase GtrA
MRPALLQFTRFLVAGAINTVASYAVFLALLEVMSYLAAYTISYVFGVVISYYLLTSFVFRTPRRVVTALRFPLVYIAQYLIGTAVMVVLVETWGVRAPIAAIAAIVASVPVSFLLSRTILRT